FQSKRRHTSCYRDWSSDVCSPDPDTRHIGRRHRCGRRTAKPADALQLSFIVLVFAINPVPHGDRLDGWTGAAPNGQRLRLTCDKIGRASCRERVEMMVVARLRKSI